MNTVEISKTKNMFEEFMKIYKEDPAEIILYGAGQGADWTIDLLQTKGIVPKSIVDKKLGGGGDKKEYTDYIL